jgi:GNAT superfamily N-acetyltransferase
MESRGDARRSRKARPLDAQMDTPPSRVVACAMEDIEIVKADASHLDLLTDVRVEFALDMHHSEDHAAIQDFARISKAYIRRHMEGGSYVGFLARMKGRTVACASLLIYELPPLLGKPDRRQGHVLNVYTAPDMRGRGIGRRMMQAVIDEGRARGLHRLFLNATKMGEPLYRSLGFHEQDEKSLVLPL